MNLPINKKEEKLNLSAVDNKDTLNVVRQNIAIKGDDNRASVTRILYWIYYMTIFIMEKPAPNTNPSKLLNYLLSTASIAEVLWLIKN